MQVITAEPDRLLRESLIKLVRFHNDAYLPAKETEFLEAGTLAEARSAMERLDPARSHALFMEPLMPDGDGLELVREIRERVDDPIVMVLTHSAELDLVTRSLDCGVRAYLLKRHVGVEELRSALRAVTSGQTYLDPRLGWHAVRAVRDAGSRGTLTEVERRLLSLSAKGLSLQQMARELYVSERTAKRHLASARRKLSAKNQVEAVASAIRLKLID